MRHRLFACTLVLILPLTGWRAIGTAQPTQLATVPAALTPQMTIPGTPTVRVTETATATLSPAPTASSTAMPTLTLSTVEEYVVLRGKINVEWASCRYGPGAMYLFLYGLLQGATQDVMGRTDTGAWVLSQARGDTARCWVKASLLDLNGDVLSVEPVYPDKYTLPVSPYYVPPYTASATRSGDPVTITWTAQSLRAGDRESDTSPLFVVETWVCQAGQLVFTPIGADVEIATVADEPGCTAPSHGRVFLAEKHGYAGPTEIPWPQATP